MLSKKSFSNALLALLSAILLYFTVSLHPVWWVAWIAPLPLLYAAFQVSNREAGWLAFAAAGAAYCSNANYYWLTSGRNVFVAVLLIGLQAFAWYAIIRYTHSRVTVQRRWYTVLAYPFAWAALDTLVTFFSPHSSFGSLAYSQGDFLPVLQIASIAGTPGIVFILGIPASVLAIVLHYRPAVRTLMPAVLVISVVLPWGAIRIFADEMHGVQLVRVGLVAIDDFISGTVPRAEADRVWNRYLQTIGDLAKQNTELILLPEKIEDFKARERSEEKLAALTEAARTHRVYIAAGVSVPQNGRLYNRLWLVGPDASAQYDKIHLVPGLESYLTPGANLAVVRIGNVRYGLGICKDYHFPSFGRRYGREGVDVVLDPAWDFEQDAWIAARLSAIRGIESGFSMFRSSREGLLTVTDQYGRIRSEMHSAPDAGKSLIADYQVPPGAPTFYARFGDVFGWLCLAAAIAMRALPFKLR